MKNDSIGARLAEFRRKLKLTQPEFANSIQKKQSTISYLENNKVAIDPETIKILYDKYQLNPSWLILGLGEMLLNKNKIDAESNARFIIQENELLHRYVSSLEQNINDKDLLIKKLYENIERLELEMKTKIN